MKSIDVTASLIAWLSGATSSAEANAANKGWAFIANGTDGWDFSSFEGTIKPQLTVTFTLPADGAAAASSLATVKLDSMSSFQEQSSLGVWDPGLQEPGLFIAA